MNYPINTNHSDAMLVTKPKVEALPLDLQPVYKAIRQAYHENSVPPALPERENGVYEYRQYQEAFSSLIESVPNTPAVYLWFARRNTEATEFIYVGESRQGLQKRFYKEFNNWHHCFWATVFHTDKYLTEAINIYVESAKYKPKKSYTNSICNDWLKRGATHVAYCVGLRKNNQLKTLQNDLIQLFENPRGNIADRRAKPLPEDKWHPLSMYLYNELSELTKNVVPYVP